MATVVIDPRYCGPDESGNGGYTCGCVAAQIGATAEVTLRVPPPLTRPLGFDGERLWDGDELVAEARPVELDVEPPGPVPYETAQAAQAPDLNSPFPHCFVCGYLRDDGLRIFAGRVDGRDLVAAPWTPRADTVGPEFVWAALDCPGAYATGEMGRGNPVLGRLAARVIRVPDAGEPCVVLGWPLGSEGRKHYAGTALYADDELLGLARATWIAPKGH